MKNRYFSKDIRFELTSEIKNISPNIKLFGFFLCPLKKQIR